MELKPHPLVERLARWGLLAHEPAPDAGSVREGWPREGEPAHVALLKLCRAGALTGGLSVALDVGPDELIGPLCARMGGAARELRVLDVREGAVPTLEVGFRLVRASWEIETLEQLPGCLNDLFAGHPEVRPAAILGEWEDALQLWCVPRARLPSLLEGALAPAWNARQLARL